MPGLEAWMGMTFRMQADGKFTLHKIHRNSFLKTLKHMLVFVHRKVWKGIYTKMLTVVPFEK